jgi:hypothetical protein
MHEITESGVVTQQHEKGKTMVKVEDRKHFKSLNNDVSELTFSPSISQEFSITSDYVSTDSGNATSANGASLLTSWDADDASGNFSKREDDTIKSEVRSAILASSFTKKKNETVENFTMNKLRYSALGLHGRDKEKEILNTCLVNVAAKDNNIKRAMIFIKGVSGTGKTALVSSLMARTKRLNGLYIKGKFDLYLRDEPYAGIAAACRGICGEILMLRDHPAQGSSTGRSFQEIHDKLIDGLGAEIHLLQKVIPELCEIVGDQQTHSEADGATGHHGNQQEAKARFNYIFRVFVRVITSYFAPLVMVLDDLQWADVGSLELMEVLITDRDNSNFMIIDLYRSNEVDDSHLMSKVLRDLMEKSKQDNFDISEIEVGNCRRSQLRYHGFAFTGRLFQDHWISRDFPQANCWQCFLFNCFHCYAAGGRIARLHSWIVQMDVGCKEDRV